MTEIFYYDRLTWPEIAGLPRDTPLVIPLGTGFSHEELTDELSSPARIGLLPPVPFGWRGSGLEVQQTLLGKMLSNLADGLQEERFSQVFILTPPGLEMELRCKQLELPKGGIISYHQPLPADSDRNKVVIIPIGHTEQHGLHSPMSTDTIIIEAIASGIAQMAPDEAVHLPVMPYGVSTHRPSFAGTLNCGGRAFEDFWLAIIDGLAERGFDRFYLLSGHGGNCSFLVNIVKYAGEKHRRIFCATSWLYLSGPKGIAALEKYRRSAIGGMGHACELETSLIMHLRPELLKMDRVIDEMDFIATPSYYMDWVEGGALIANPPWDDDTRTGAYGAGSFATAENGKIWLEAAIAEKVEHVQEIHQQSFRRNQRRDQGFGLWGNAIKK